MQTTDNTRLERKNNYNAVMCVWNDVYRIHAICIKGKSIPSLSRWWNKWAFKLGLRDHKLDSVSMAVGIRSVLEYDGRKGAQVCL